MCVPFQSVLAFFIFFPSLLFPIFTMETTYRLLGFFMPIWVFPILAIYHKKHLPLGIEPENDLDLNTYIHKGSTTDKTKEFTFFCTKARFSILTSWTKEWKINGFGLNPWRSMAIRIGISIRSVCLLAQKFLNSRVFSWRSITHESLGMHSYARTIISMIKERKLFSKKGSSSTMGSKWAWKIFLRQVQVF